MYMLGQLMVCHVAQTLLSRVAGLNESTNDLFIQGIIFETLFLLGTKCSKLCLQAKSAPFYEITTAILMQVQCMMGPSCF